MMTHKIHLLYIREALYFIISIYTGVVGGGEHHLDIISLPHLNYVLHIMCCRIVVVVVFGMRLLRAPFKKYDDGGGGATNVVYI